MKHQLKKRKIRDQGKFRNALDLMKVVEAEQANEISEPESSDNDNSPTALTEFMDKLEELRKYE